MKYLALIACLLLAQVAKATEYVVVVLDASGSMNGNLGPVDKMEAAKTALITTLKTVPDDTHVGIVVFSAQGISGNDCWIFPLGPIDKPKVEQAIQKVFPSGGTPLGEYLKIGADVLLDKRKKNGNAGTYRLVAVTDGEANDGNLVDRYMPEIMKRGLIVDTIGVGMKDDHSLAKMTSSYRRANDPNQFIKAVSEIFAEVSPTANDQSDDSAYDLIAPLESDSAVKMIAALNTMHNEPIGEQVVVQLPEDLQQFQNAVNQPVTNSSMMGPGLFFAFIVVCALVVVFFLIVR